MNKDDEESIGEEVEATPFLYEEPLLPSAEDEGDALAASGDGEEEDPFSMEDEGVSDADFQVVVVDEFEDGDKRPDEDPEESPEDEADEEEDAGDDLPALPLASVVEAILFAAREPLKPAQIARAAGKRTRQDAVRAAIGELNVQYLESGRAFEIAEISGRFQLMSRPEYVEHIMRIYPKRELAEKERAARLSPAALDTLAIIAYKQPVTRGEIEHIRGVGCGPVLRALMERGTVKVAGKAQVVGQPWLYGTTEAFLAEFGLGSIEELPLRSEFLSLVGSAVEADQMEEAEEQDERRMESEIALVSAWETGADETFDTMFSDDAVLPESLDGGGDYESAYD